MPESALSKMLIFDSFQVSGTQAEMNNLDPSTCILPPFMKGTLVVDIFLFIYSVTPSYKFHDTQT